MQAHRLQTVASVDDATFEAQLADIESAGQEITSVTIFVMHRYGFAACQTPSVPSPLMSPGFESVT